MEPETKEIFQGWAEVDTTGQKSPVQERKGQMARKASTRLCDHFSTALEARNAYGRALESASLEC